MAKLGVTPNIYADGMAYRINVVAAGVAGNTAQTQEKIHYRYGYDRSLPPFAFRIHLLTVGMKQPASLRPEFKGFAEAFSTIMIQCGWEGGRLRKRQCEMANGLNAAISISGAGSYVVSIVAEDKTGNESSQVDFPVVIPVIDVTPPTTAKAQRGGNGSRRLYDE